VKFINAKACRDFALEAAKVHRPAHPFERVSKEFLEQLNNDIRNLIISRVRNHPSVGKTIK
jgi:hypothetical protein